MGYEWRGCYDTVVVPRRAPCSNIVHHHWDLSSDITDVSVWCNDDFVVQFDEESGRVEVWQINDDNSVESLYSFNSKMNRLLYVDESKIIAYNESHPSFHVIQYDSIF